MSRFAFANDILPINPAEWVSGIIRNIDPRAPLPVYGAVDNGNLLPVVERVATGHLGRPRGVHRQGRPRAGPDLGEVDRIDRRAAPAGHRVVERVRSGAGLEGVVVAGDGEGVARATAGERGAVGGDRIGLDSWLVARVPA